MKGQTLVLYLFLLESLHGLDSGFKELLQFLIDVVIFVEFSLG